mgnify:FL=1
MIDALCDVQDECATSDLFTLNTLVIDEKPFEFSIPYSVSHSELFAAIAAYHDIQEDPSEAIENGVMKTFEQSKMELQMLYLFGEEGSQELIFEAVENYLAKYPNETVSEYVGFARNNLPEFGTFGFDEDEPESLGFDSSKKERIKKEKQREKNKRRMRKQSQRINRKK